MELLMEILKKLSFEKKATVCKYIVPKGYPESGKAGQILDVNESKINEKGQLFTMQQ